MSDDLAAARRRRHDAGSTIALLVTLTAALLPLLTVVAAGPWIALALGGAATLLTAGYLARRLSAPAVGVTALELALWTAGTTAVFFADAAWFAVVPTPEVLDRVSRMIGDAAASITAGVAPLDPTSALSFVIVSAVGILVIALDHVVLTARMPLLATVALIAIWLIPTLAVPSGVDVGAFVLLAAAMLWLIRAETRSRAPDRAPGSPTGGVGVVSAVIATAAIVVSVVAAPALPQSATTGGIVSGTTIDASLDLGDDLRRPAEVAVVRTWGDTPSPPYLRVATLSRLDGDTWRPDRGRSITLEEWDGAAPETVEEVRVAQYRTHVEVLDLASSSLPVPYPAISMTGLDGAWLITPDNRTVRSPATAARGQRVEVLTAVPQPSLEQARASRAASGGVRLSSALELPFQLPPNIARLAEEVTADAGTDYDRLLALQSWFRGSSFEYSLDAPVRQGFDGSGADAVGEFLDVRAGYCVHFASAFALMARTLDMPSRVVVGFLPGAPTGDTADDERVYEATTAQLHAWPEVLFEGIGWVAFEPTKSLGSAQRFTASDIAPDDTDPAAAPTPTPTASSSASADPRGEEDTAGGSTAGRGLDLADLLPLLAILLSAGTVIAGPGLLRRAREGVLRRRARDGSVAAAWRLVRDAAIDVGIAVPAAESPRAFGSRLAAAHGAGAPAIGRLVDAVERASYAPVARRGAVAGADLARDAVGVRRDLLAAASPGRRAAARVLPRSLVVRPGSAFAAPAPAGA